jgi:hypothetical protein
VYNIPQYFTVLEKLSAAFSQEGILMSLDFCDESI